MTRIENQKITGQKIIEMTSCKVGVIIRYCGERFDVERARDNGYGAVLIFNYHGDCHGMEFTEEVEVLGYFNL